MRICSLLPSATEIVFALGLGDQLVAVTHECDHPPEATSLPRITASSINHQGSSGREIHRHISEAVHSGSSVYSLDQAMLERLDPDLLLTQELCDVCAVSYRIVRDAVRMLAGPRKVVSLEPTNLRGILETIEEVAKLNGVPERAEELVKSLTERIDRVAERAMRAKSSPRVAALEWLDPPFAGGHWVPEMIRLAGGVDCLGEEGSPSREVSWEEIADSDPELVVLMPCGFDLERTITEARNTTFPEQWRSLAAVRNGRVTAVDGSSYFNRPGPRVVDGLEILAEILQPDLFPSGTPSRHSPFRE